LERYGVRAEQAQRIGLPCGGTLGLLVERLDSADQLMLVLARMEAQQTIDRNVCLTTGECSLHSSESGGLLRFDGDNLRKTFGPQWRLLLIGAGELTRRVAQLALTLEFAVTICDPRPEYAPQTGMTWLVEGTLFDTRSPIDVVNRFRPDVQAAILALSHTPTLDDEALILALQSEAFYVGALGSKKNQQARYERLRQRGLDDRQLKRLHAPVGLAIGSRTPAEIAVAIAADLIQSRQGVAQPKRQAVHV
jgi:xanthine dehydrogenase accessory factor